MNLLKKALASLVILAISFLAQAAKPDPITLPVQTPLFGFDADNNGVIVFYKFPYRKGGFVYHPFEIALQASADDASSYFQGKIENLRVGLKNKRMEGASEKDLPPEVTLDSLLKKGVSREAALTWLERHMKRVGPGAAVWHYDFDNAYNDVEVKRPWGSAFGQAHVIRAFAKAYRETGKAKYRDIALAAAKTYGIPIKDGGFRATLSDGSTFFEEVPVEPASHILNGHMISTIALLELNSQFPTPWLKKLSGEGLATLRKNLARYDLGYWSRYDMNPKKSELIFRLSPHSNYPQSPILVDRVKLVNAQDFSAVDLDVGAADDSVGAWRISGIEWQQGASVDGRSARGVGFGPALHCGPVKGGSLQNSYIILQLPNLKFIQYSNLPPYFLEIYYKDNYPGKVSVEIQDINHGNFLGFRVLSQGVVSTRGSGQWRVARVPVLDKDLAWFMGADYQIYHVELLKRLHVLTGDDFFIAYSERWKGYYESLLERDSDIRSGVEFNYESFQSVRSDCPARVD